MTMAKSLAHIDPPLESGPVGSGGGACGASIGLSTAGALDKSGGIMLPCGVGAFGTFRGCGGGGGTTVLLRGRAGGGGHDVGGGADLGGGGGATDSISANGAPNSGVAKPPGPKINALDIESPGDEEGVCCGGPAGALLVGETGWTQGSYPALAVELTAPVSTTGVVPSARQRPAPTRTQLASL